MCGRLVRPVKVWPLGRDSMGRGAAAIGSGRANNLSDVVNGSHALSLANDLLLVASKLVSKFGTGTTPGSGLLCEIHWKPSQ